MQNKKNRHFQSAIIVFIISSLLVCIACNVSNSNRFYFATSVNGESTLGAQYLAASSSFQLDFAGEETLRSATSSYSNYNQSVMRSHRSNYHSNLIFAVFLISTILILTNNLRSYGYQILPKQNFSCIRIARFIEHSDGKK